MSFCFRRLGTPAFVSLLIVCLHWILPQSLSAQAYEAISQYQSYGGGIAYISQRTLLADEYATPISFSSIQRQEYTVNITTPSRAKSNYHATWVRSVLFFEWLDEVDLVDDEALRIISAKYAECQRLMKKHKHPAALLGCKLKQPIPPARRGRFDLQLGQ